MDPTIILLLLFLALLALVLLVLGIFRIRRERRAPIEERLGRLEGPGPRMGETEPEIPASPEERPEPESEPPQEPVEASPRGEADVDKPAPAAPPPEGEKPRDGSLLRRIERSGNGGRDGEAAPSPMGRRQAMSPAGGSYADLPTRLRNQLAEQISAAEIAGGDPRALRTQVEALFEAFLREENVVLSRSERKRLFEAAVADILGTGALSVQFSAYYPKEVAVDDWQPLHAYVFKDMAGAAVSADATEKLGERQDIRKVSRPAKQPVPAGVLITATPLVDGLEFNPPSLSLRFVKDWHRFDFEFRAVDAPPDEAANGRLTFTVEGVIVADLPLSVYVGESAAAEESMQTATARPYEAIFCSYSHRDQRIVERVEGVCRLLGMDYLRDVTTLKSGQHWDEELLRLIERADIFQLFWSEHAAASEHVEREWRHALTLGREGAAFIRPVYWSEPIAEPPPELRHIHFAYQPELND